MLTTDGGEVLLPVPDAFEEATGYRPSHASCWRWTKKGVNGVRLETVRVGSRVKTSRSAVMRFVAAQNRDDDRDEQVDDEPKGRSSNETRDRSRQLAAAS